MPQPHRVGGHQHADGRGLGHGHRLQKQQQPLLGQAVHQHSRRQREEADGQELEHHRRAQRHRRWGEGGHQPALGRVLHPGAGEGDGLPRPVEAVVAHAQGGEGARQLLPFPPPEEERPAEAPFTGGHDRKRTEAAPSLYGRGRYSAPFPPVVPESPDLPGPRSRG